MPSIELTPFSLAQRYIGIHELATNGDHPLIQWWLSLCGFPTDVTDEVPWCSAFLNGICWELRLPRSKSAAARSWLKVGQAIQWEDLRVGWDVVILNRGGIPNPTVLNAPGHVGLYAGSDLSDESYQMLAGNQGDAVSIAKFHPMDVLGFRRLTF